MNRAFILNLSFSPLKLNRSKSCSYPINEEINKLNGNKLTNALNHEFSINPPFSKEVVNQLTLGERWLIHQDENADPDHFCFAHELSLSFRILYLAHCLTLVRVQRKKEKNNVWFGMVCS